MVANRLLSVLAAASTLCLMSTSSPAADAPKTLADFLAAEWDYTMEHNPTWASSLGDDRFNDRWSDESLAAIEAGHAHALDALARLRAIDRAALTPADQLNYDLYQRNLQTDIDGYRFRFFLCPVSQQGGVQDADDILTNLRFAKKKDYEDWCARLEKLPTLIEQDTGLMRQGIKEHILQPKVVMARIPAQIAKQLVDKPEDSPFCRPFKAPAGLSPEDAKALDERARRAIADGVIPAYRQFNDFFTKEYLPACYDQVGIWQMPDGAAAYAYFARQHTTTDLTPEQIHEIGLKEVARIRAEMETLKTKVGFQGTLPEFFKFLRTDPQFFYHEPPTNSSRAYKVQAKTTDPLLPQASSRPCRATALRRRTHPRRHRAGHVHGVLPAGFGGGRARAGMFCVNLYKPETRPKWEMTALALHESVPGSPSANLAGAGTRRRCPSSAATGPPSYTAFVEGWALYSEFLGEEMGEYNDPYAKFGELTYEMWRAVRLVVDTGIHYYHWDRQKAIDYFMANAPKSELDITNEVDRYIAWPGQALAYKIGQLKIKELRARATAKLGERFDVREFHDAVLGGGAVPLDVLEHRIDEWIATQQAARN